MRSVGSLPQCSFWLSTPDSHIMCTSTVDEDAPLERIAKDEGISCYRGDLVDVLLRLTNAAEEFNVDTVISCTADNPLTDPAYIDKIVQFHHEGRYDYSETEGLPFSTFSYAMSRPAMKRACAIKAKRDTEVWRGYFTETGEFKVGVLEVSDDKVRRPNLRLTVDTPDDFELMSHIFESLHNESSVFRLKEAIDLIDSKPGLVSINKNVERKKPVPIKLNR